MLLFVDVFRGLALTPLWLNMLCEWEWCNMVMTSTPPQGPVDLPGSSRGLSLTGSKNAEGGEGWGGERGGEQGESKRWEEKREMTDFKIRLCYNMQRAAKIFNQ